MTADVFTRTCTKQHAPATTATIARRAGRETMRLNDIINPIMRDKKRIEFINQIMHLNESALNISLLHPITYHTRSDFRAYVDLRNKIIAEKGINDEPRD